MSEEDKAESATSPSQIICDYRDRGLPGARAALRRAAPRDDGAGWSARRSGRVRPDADGGDGARRHRRPSGPGAREQSAREAFPVVVIGCGQSGLLAGIRLQEAGIPFTIVEKNAGVGGTWWENSYPGARVDVGNHFYCYSFEPSDDWTEYFARQPELQRTSSR